MAEGEGWGMSAVPAGTEARLLLMYVRGGMEAWRWVQQRGACRVRQVLVGGVHKNGWVEGCPRNGKEDAGKKVQNRG